MIDGSNLSGVSSQIFALVIFASIFVILATLTIQKTSQTLALET